MLLLNTFALVSYTRIMFSLNYLMKAVFNNPQGDIIQTENIYPQLKWLIKTIFTIQEKLLVNWKKLVTLVFLNLGLLKNAY